MLELETYFYWNFEKKILNESDKKQKEKVSENGSSGANGCPKLTTKLKLLEPLTIEEEENGRLAAKDICQKVFILIILTA